MSNLVTDYLLTMQMKNVPMLDTICMDVAKSMNFFTLSCPRSELHTIVSSLTLRFEYDNLYSAVHGRHNVEVQEF